MPSGDHPKRQYVQLPTTTTMAVSPDTVSVTPRADDAVVLPPISCWRCGGRIRPGVTFGYAWNDAWICKPCSDARVPIA